MRQVGIDCCLSGQRPEITSHTVGQCHSILMLIPHLAKGGAERQCVLLCCGLARLGWNVSIGVSRGDSIAEEALHKSGVTVHLLPVSSNYEISLPWRIAGIIRRQRPDLVMTWMRQMDVLGGMLAKLSRVPWVLTERSSALAYSSRMDSLRRYLGNWADMIIANSRRGCDYWHSKMPEGNITEIPNGIDLEALKESESATLEGWDGPLFLMAGRLEGYRNPRALIDAVAPLCKSNACRLVICGDGPLLGDCKELIKASGLSNRVHLLGRVEPKDVWRWMCRASALVSLSDFEGQPNAVMEAMALVCPLVVSDIPEHQAFLNEETAVFVNHRDIRGITKALTKIISDPLSAADRATRAADIVAQWTIDEMARRYDLCLRDVLHHKHNLRKDMSCAA